MSIKKRIEKLVEAADKLRLLEDDDLHKVPLGSMVDEINALRAVQAQGGFVDSLDAEELGEIERADAKAKREAAEYAELERQEAADKLRAASKITLASVVRK